MANGLMVGVLGPWMPEKARAKVTRVFGLCGRGATTVASLVGALAEGGVTACLRFSRKNEELDVTKVGRLGHDGLDLLLRTACGA